VRPLRASLLVAVTLLGCGGGSDIDDAGITEGVVLTVTAATSRDQINGVSPRMGYQYYLLDTTIEARGVGPISIAPFAYQLTLEDGTRVTGDSRTNELADGCTSRSVAVDEVRACRLLFLVLTDASPPATLSWTDMTESARASVPPLS